MIKAVIFDLDDTLYEYKRINELAIKELCTYTCNSFKITEQEFEEAFLWARMQTKDVLKNTAACHNRLLYCQKLLEYIGENPVCSALDMYDIYWNYMLEHMSLNDGVLEVFEYCRKQKISIGICSDLTIHIQHRKLRRLGIAQYIDAIVTSEEAGAEKPSKVMFEMIMEKLNVTADEVLFIGDSLEKDVIGAEKCGIKGIWYNETTDEVYTSIQSIREVISLVDEYK